MGFVVPLPTPSSMPGTGGPFLAGPAPAGTPGFGNTTYGNGGVTTSTGGGPGGSSRINDLLAALLEKKLNPAPLAPKPQRNVLGAKAATSHQAQPRQTSGGEGPARKSPAMEALEARKAADAYELTRRSAATRPVGLGPGMIPGMAPDPRLLPSSMLPDQAGISGPTHSVPRGSITPAEPGDPPQAQKGAASGGGSASDDGRLQAILDLLQQAGIGKKA